MSPLLTARSRLRPLALTDDTFILRLLNDPGWLRFIGDKGVRTLEDARRYIETGPLAMYAQQGFGLLLVERLTDGAPMGLCGLLKRDSLPDVDIGFAFLPEFGGQGHALEAAGAVMNQARSTLGLRRVVAITTPDNGPSGRLLEKLGMRFERMLRMPPKDEELRLFAWNAD